MGIDYSDVHFGAMIGSGRASGNSVAGIAVELGVNEDDLRAHMDGDEVAATITRNYAAMQAMDISGTPAFIVAGSPSRTELTNINTLPGAVPVEELRAIIQQTRIGS